MAIQIKYDDLDTPLMGLLAAILGAYFHGKDEELMNHVAPKIEGWLQELMEDFIELQEEEDEGYVM
jgi:hypothetical protein